jgi:hypothetical protein
MAMRKKSVLFAFGATLFILGISFASAAMCDPSVELLNQDPYPAVPGNYVKVVFQVTGLENPDCKEATFTLDENFPFSLDPGKSASTAVWGGIYTRNYNASFLVPYDIRVDQNALDGNNTIEATLQFKKADGSVIMQIEQFDIEVQGADVDFEISVKDYDSTTDSLTLEILNIGKYDVMAVTLEIPKQENIVVKGSNRDIAGDLDANEDIEVQVLYTNDVHDRKSITKSVLYDSSYFTNRKADQSESQSVYFYLFYLLILVLVVLWGRGKWKKRKMKEHLKEHEKKR